MSDPVVYEFKRGDDFLIPMTLTNPDNNGSAVDITGWTITSQIRYSRQLIDTLDVVITNGPGGAFQISKGYASTIMWPTRDLRCDIQFDRPVDGRISSQTFIVRVAEDQTRD